MNGPINQLVKSLLQKDSLEVCSLQELQQYAEKYPYFGAAQLLLAKKLQTENTEQYEQQFQKTCLFFHNPLWVQQLLTDTGSATVKPGGNITIAAAAIAESKETPIEVAASEVQTASPIATSAPVDVAVTESSTPETIETEGPLPTKETKAETAPFNTAASDLVFEPYHTVDYFASQGIKFKEEEKPADKFSQQLKSFTEWLKTMKRLPVADIAKSVETASEKKVEQLAEHSLEDREVITEAMAAVWEKQGNREKAIEVYSKLSLLEPSKSPYFAAKIELLKKDN
ncbi:MAG TPA: hypothetical protein VFV31_09445 [Chitinophagaceae bacterium]|nr:hypothetical protein [Chitinophagaceae bacterium]